MTRILSIPILVFLGIFVAIADAQQPSGLATKWVKFYRLVLMASLTVTLHSCQYTCPPIDPFDVSVPSGPPLNCNYYYYDGIVYDFTCRFSVVRTQFSSFHGPYPH